VIVDASEPVVVEGAQALETPPVSANAPGPEAAGAPEIAPAPESAPLPAADPAAEAAPPVETPEDVELRFAATQAKKAADQALTEMYATIPMRKSEALNYKRSLGPEINQFADRVEAEALLFVRYTYMTKSGGEIAKDVAFSVLLLAATLGNATVIGPVTLARVDVCLVDGATGDVLFANTASAQQFVGDPSVDGLTTAALDGFSPR
jgi:hypothetical protein